MLYHRPRESVVADRLYPLRAERLLGRARMPSAACAPAFSRRLFPGSRGALRRRPLRYLERTVMKVVIFAGGYGTRISEETVTLPKPLVEIGAMPMLWHIMKIYAAHGLNDFVICCGYKGHLIKKYFLDFFHRCRRPDHRPRHQQRRGQPGGERALAGDARRHRARDDDRRAAQARARLSRRRDLLPDLRRRGQRHRHHRADRLPPRPGHARHRDRRAAARPLRRARLLRRRQAGRRLPREERRRRPPDQRRLLRLRAGGDRPRRGRRHGLGGGAAEGAGRRRPARGLPPQGLLAEHGHAARQARAAGDVGQRARRPGRSGTGRVRPPAAERE